MSYVVKSKKRKLRDTGDYLRHRFTRGHELSRVPIEEALRFGSRESAIEWCKEFVRRKTGDWRDYAVVVEIVDTVVPLVPR